MKSAGVGKKHLGSEASSDKVREPLHNAKATAPRACSRDGCCAYRVYALRGCMALKACFFLVGTMPCQANRVPQ
eukprot:970404-Prorocentrum_lima.AAC.1